MKPRTSIGILQDRHKDYYYFRWFKMSLNKEVCFYSTTNRLPPYGDRRSLNLDQTFHLHNFSDVQYSRNETRIWCS